MSDVSESLISLTKNDRPWAITLEEISDRERIIKNERMSELLIFLSKLLIRSFFDKKPAIRLEIKWANSQPWWWAINSSYSFLFILPGLYKFFKE